MLKFTATRIATAILNGFEAAIEDHNRVTLGARERFEQADWQAAADAQKHRADVYRAGIEKAAAKLKLVADEALHNQALWADVKREFAQMIEDHDNRNITQTFYNSVYSNWFSFERYDNQYLFVEGEGEKNRDVSARVFNRFRHQNSFLELAINLLDRYQFSVSWRHLEQDAQHIAEALESQLLPLLQAPLAEIEVQVLKSVFYRNKGAYLVGRILHGETITPLVLPISNIPGEGVFVDAAIINSDDVSVIFSFTRSHFMVDAPIPQAYVNFLHTIMPEKHRYELYTSLGFIKHGKTEFVRDFVNHSDSSDDQLVMAAGTRGMVMSVFTLESYDVVFKIIKDRFRPPKSVTRAQVKAKYRLVSRHDRAGRMADTQEFNNFWFQQEEFDPDCLAELLRECAATVELKDNRVLIKHLYIERRMEPLNLFVNQQPNEAIASAMEDYGNAIREIAGANIFPGDMLLKNFGVTRHGRVIFYDYDEICFLDECNFRDIPPPRNARDEMSSVPWYSVSENDVFPEEFSYFFSGNPHAKEAFETFHSDLYQRQTWQEIQRRIRDGESSYVYPYRVNQRFYPQIKAR